MMFQKGGNAVDAACAMLGATATMYDALSWGGETQALIFNPHTGKVPRHQCAGSGSGPVRRRSSSGSKECLIRRPTARWLQSPLEPQEVCSSCWPSTGP